MTWSFVVKPVSKRKELTINYLKYLTNSANDMLIGEINSSTICKV